MRNGVVDTVLFRNVHLNRDGGLADIRRRRAGALYINVGDGDARALRHIGFGEGEADAARCAGDEGGFSGEAGHWMVSGRREEGGSVGLAPDKPPPSRP